MKYQIIIEDGTFNKTFKIFRVNLKRVSNCMPKNLISLADRKSKPYFCKLDEQFKINVIENYIMYLGFCYI